MKVSLFYTDIDLCHIFRVYQLESSYKNRNDSRYLKKSIIIQGTDYMDAGRLKT